MASAAQEDVGQSSSAVSDGSQSLPPQAGPPEEDEDSLCPICLGHMMRPAYVTYCMHKFCHRCIWEWSLSREDCPVCRQPIEKLLHSVRGDNDYKECSVGLAGVLERRMARERIIQRVRQATLDQHRLAVRRRIMDIVHAQRRATAPEVFDTNPQQSPAAPPEMAPLRADEPVAGPAAPLEPQNGTE